MDRFSGSQPVSKYDDSELEFHSWFERDRACVEIRHADTGVSIWEAWDEQVGQLIEDGFLDPRNLEESAKEYARYIGLI